MIQNNQYQSTPKQIKDTLENALIFWEERLKKSEKENKYNQETVLAIKNRLKEEMIKEIEK